MRCALRLIILTAAIPVLAGCGGSSHPATGGATAAATSTVGTRPPGSTTSDQRGDRTSTSTSLSASAPAPSSGSAAGSGGAGLTSGSGAPSSAGASAGGSIDARVPATFALSAAGKLRPGQVSAPAFLAVAVRISSDASAAHTATIAIAHPVRLQIPPHGVGAKTISGLRAGIYPILIDGVRRGDLLIGGEPGP